MRAVNVWTEGQALSFNIVEPAERSNTVTTVLVKDGHDLKALHRYWKEKCGVIIGSGIGELTGKAFRIAHMGHVNAPMMLRKWACMLSKSRTAMAGCRPRPIGSEMPSPPERGLRFRKSPALRRPQKTLHAIAR